LMLRATGAVRISGVVETGGSVASLPAPNHSGLRR
jgi:hypothetical protein